MASFDTDAREAALRLAAACGAPKTREEGLRAIHAVALLRRGVFTKDQDAWETWCGTGPSARRRFYEWKKKLSSTPFPCSQPTGEDEVQADASAPNTILDPEEPNGSRLDTRPGAEVDDILEVMVDIEEHFETPEERRLRLQRKRSADYRQRLLERSQDEKARQKAEEDAALLASGWGASSSTQGVYCNIGICAGCNERRALGARYQQTADDGTVVRRWLQVMYSYLYKSLAVCHDCHTKESSYWAVRGSLLRRQAWQHLTTPQQEAAACFGFSEPTWNARYGENLPGLPTCRSSSGESYNPCLEKQRGEIYQSYVWNGCAACRGDNDLWEELHKEISCAWFHAWDDLTPAQRRAAQVLGYQGGMDMDGSLAGEFWGTCPDWDSEERVDDQELTDEPCPFRYGTGDDDECCYCMSQTAAWCRDNHGYRESAVCVIM